MSSKIMGFRGSDDSNGILCYVAVWTGWSTWRLNPEEHYRDLKV